MEKPIGERDTNIADGGAENGRDAEGFANADSCADLRAEIRAEPKQIGLKMSLLKPLEDMVGRKEISDKLQFVE